MRRTPALTRLALLATSALATLLSGCGGGGGNGGGSGNDPCGESARKRWVLDVAREWYLFPETLPASVTLGDYATAEELLDALTAGARAQGRDRFFSYLTTKAEENSLLGEGEFIGFGFRTRTDPGNRPMLVDVFEGGPAADAGLVRGDEIVAVDQGSGFVPVRQSLAGGGTITDLLGAAEQGVVRGLRVLRSGSTFDVSLTKRTVAIDPVSDDFGVQVLPLAGTAGVGYVNLRTYITPADPELRAAFQQFRDAGLQYFIVDLRYNGGGLVSIAQIVNDLLGGARRNEDAQFHFVYNAAKSNRNSTVGFQPRAQSVQPVRIAFLTTDGTASASEMNVNSMKPWVEVAIVGSNTYGKPVGQEAFDLSSSCPDRLRLITFRTTNALDEGDYYDGLASKVDFACAATDTLGQAMGDPAEGLTGEALHWLGTGACTSVIASGTPGGAAKGTLPEDRYPRSRHPSAAEFWLPGVG